MAKKAKGNAPRKIVRTWESYGGAPCSRCSGVNDPYMVTFILWQAVIPREDRRKLICLECFEKALGRELRFNDFIHKNSYGVDLPINYGMWGFNVVDFLKNRGKIEG